MPEQQKPPEQEPSTRPVQPVPQSTPEQSKDAHVPQLDDTQPTKP